MCPDGASAGDDQPFRLIGTDGEHGLAREVVCSLPRSVSCRLCRGEADCPYIVERPYGRLVVRKRDPVELIARDVTIVATGSADDGRRTSGWQLGVALAAWVSLPVAAWWTLIVHPPVLEGVVVPAAVMLATFALTVVGVPIVRWRWRDHGGRRSGGPWRPS